MLTEFRRTIAYILAGIALIMLLNEIEIYSLNLGFDKILVCAILIFLFQVILIISFAYQPKRMKSSDIFGLVLFPIPPIIYIAIFYFGFPFVSHIQLIVVLTLFVESIYALGM
jgi:hypothetical protein